MKKMRIKTEKGNFIFFIICELLLIILTIINFIIYGFLINSILISITVFLLIIAINKSFNQMDKKKKEVVINGKYK